MKTPETLEETIQALRTLVPEGKNLKWDYQNEGNSLYYIEECLDDKSYPVGETYNVAHGLEDYHAEFICNFANHANDLLEAAEWAIENGYEQ